MYNVTPYFEFHPGGEDELMRGVGKDATDLFNEVRDSSFILYLFLPPSVTGRYIIFLIANLFSALVGVLYII